MLLVLEIHCKALLGLGYQYSYMIILYIFFYIRKKYMDVFNYSSKSTRMVCIITKKRKINR